MRVATLTGVNELEVQERDRPAPAADEVLVRVGACGICMTDYHMYHGTFEVETPMVPGHESAGIIVEVGDEVREFETGHRVAINPTIPCHTCSYCKRGEAHLCEHNTSIGGAADNVLDGAFAEYVRVPHTNVRNIGPLDFDTAALAEPLACCVHGVDRVDPGQGDSVAIIGAGPIGLMLLQTFRMRGTSPIVVSEPHKHRREVAVDLGADAVVDPDAVTDPVGAITDAAGGPVDVGAEAVGRVPTIKQANGVTARGGSTLLFGVPDQDATMEVNPFDVFFTEIDYRGSYSLTPGDFERSVRMLQHGRIDAERLISDRIGLDEITSAFTQMGNNEGLKKIVHPGTGD